MDAVLAIYGSHNSTISLALNGNIVEVVEIERLVNKKNASLFFYEPTQVQNSKEVLLTVKELFKDKYNIDHFSFCYYDMVDLDMVKEVYSADEYIQTSHHRNHSCSSLYQSTHEEALVLSFDGGGNDGWFRLFRHKRKEEPENILDLQINYGVCYGMVGHFVSELKHEEDYLRGNLVYAGKLMGLAGYGVVRQEWLEEFEKWYDLPSGVEHETLFEEMLNRLNIPLNDNKLANSKDSKDLAATNQFMLEEKILKLINPHLDSYPDLPIHITGGGGLNILFNTRLSTIRETFVTPNPSDCGLAVGMLCGHIKPEHPIDITYSGPNVFDKFDLGNLLNANSFQGKFNISTNLNYLVEDLKNGKIVGVVRGRCEHGPRALGNRSILCNPSFPDMKDLLNLKVKHREQFRPFAPVVRLEDVSTYFEFNKESRWMNYCPKVKDEWKEKLQAITHVDGTARVQTVTEDQNPWLYKLLTEFKNSTGIGVLLNTSFNVDGKPILNTYNDAFKVYSETELDSLVLQDTYICKEVSKEEKPSDKLTVVTGLWNIDNHRKSFDVYIEHLQKLLTLDCNLFLYLPSELEKYVWEKRNRNNTHVQVYELSDIKDMYGDFWDLTQNIRTSESWQNLTGEGGWLKESPQLKNEWYNPIVMSKMSLLHNSVIWNPFNSDYFMWLDAGITTTVNEGYFAGDWFDKIIDHFDPFLFLSYPYKAVDEVHGFTHEGMQSYTNTPIEYVCRGGLFGGTADSIRDANGKYWHLLNSTLRAGLMGTEESIFTILAYQEPENFRRYMLDDNGLIVKFAINLINDKVELEKIPEKRIKYKKVIYNTNKVKTNLYILTFNFPDQVLYTIESMKKVPEWLERPHLVLLDNSTDSTARQDNKEIAEEYNFEYISLEGNKGICGGRQVAAEHFHESDADYYFFFEDDMTSNPPTFEGQFCRNGLRKYIPNLYDILHKIMIKENFDYLKMSFTEVYWDNNIQTSWYNVPQDIRTQYWPEYDQLPTTGKDPNAPRTQFKQIDNVDGVAYIDGDITYTNWPMIMSKEGNYKVFIETKWDNPFEQTWMSYVFQKQKKGEIKAGVLLASPIWHERIKHYKPEERREN